MRQVKAPRPPRVGSHWLPLASSLPRAGAVKQECRFGKGSAEQYVVRRRTNSDSSDGLLASIHRAIGGYAW